jgi:hypothetical protein
MEGSNRLAARGGTKTPSSHFSTPKRSTFDFSDPGMLRNLGAQFFFGRFPAVSPFITASARFSNDFQTTEG